MKSKLHYYLMASFLALSGAFCQAFASDFKTAYALSDNDDYGKGIYSFELGDTIKNVSMFQPMTFNAVCGGQIVNNIYYYFEYEQVYNGIKVHGLWAFDMDSKTQRQIADYGGVNNGQAVSNFSYDYQSGTMYGLNSFNGGDNLVKIDLETGAITDLGKLTYDVINTAAQASSMEEHMHVMTSTYDGEMYGVSYWGSLYKINQHTCECQYIGTLDYNPGDAFMYSGDCLFYDNDTGKLYLRFTTYNWSTSSWIYDAVMIDPKTAHVIPFAKFQDASHASLTAISVPFTVAEASAPAKVQNLSITKGQQGALTATVEWDNPSKTYGRGGTLEELNYVLVLRDGVVVDSITNPVIGGHQTWTDNNITERGYYTYRIVPGNSIGRGDRASVGAYIGKGDPLGVTDVKLVADGDYGKLSWTAPTEGKLGSYIDTNTLNYDVVRFKNSDAKGDQVATGIKETSFTDDKLTEMGKYTYAIVPHTDNATGDTVRSEAVILGPSFTIPATFAFNSTDEFYLWTTIDANGNYSTWTWSNGMYGTLKGATCSYAYDGYAAADWLISPRIRLEAGKKYKVTFDALPGNKKIPETLAVSFGQGTDIASQDSVKQFDIVSDKTVSLRANLPEVTATGNYNVGFLYRTAIENYQLSIGNVQVSEDHEGYVEGTVTSNGTPIAGATVVAAAGKYNDVTDENGKYRLEYLSEGDYDIDIRALGYEDVSAKVSVKEYEVSQCDIDMTALPKYEVKGKVVDVAGDPVAGAKVVLSGYDNDETETATDGTFTFPEVFKNGNYAVSITKNKLLEGSKNFGVEADTDLGTITLLDNQKPAGKVSVTEEGNSAQITWKAPANDAVVQRIDDGTLTTSIGISNSNSNSMFGVVKREPQSVTGVQFFIDGTPTITHYSVQLNIFDLDENGQPTDKLLYRNTYVPATDGQWNYYTLPAPVDAPNGYYLAITYSGYLLVGIDGNGDSEKYPFVEGVNCFTPDYTTGQYYYLEGQTNPDFHHNFLIRPVAAPFTVPEDSTEFKAPAQKFVYKKSGNQKQIELDSKVYENKPSFDESPMMKTPQSRIRYNVYRMNSADIADESKWTLLSENQQARSYEDTEWSGLAQGVYAYAVKAAYTGGTLATASVSDSIGNKMNTNVTFRLTTDTPENEAYGANVRMSDGTHVYVGTADDQGNVEIPNVWKSIYNVTVTLDGFKTYTDTISVNKEESYEFAYNITENRIKPYNLIIEDGETATDRVFMWNYPDVFFDDFEGHEDFAINSPGTLGWQYIDGDGCETGGFSGYEWPGMFEPMAYIIFNQNTTTPSTTDLYYLAPYSGVKCQTAWASYGMANDDWMITPKLHFQKDFKFTFYASSSDYSYLEDFEVAYSTTDTQPESFIKVQEATQAPSYWTMYSYDIPKEAKYVAIHCVSDQKRIFRIDDVRYGLAEALNVPTYISRSTGYESPIMRSPSLDGLYEVYLDGNKVAQQDATTYTFSNLTSGKHTAGVIASYTSGKTEMSTIDFSVDASGIATVEDGGLNISVDGKIITVNGAYDRLEVFSTSGMAVSMTENAQGCYNMGNVPAGVYIIKVYVGSKVSTMKFTVK